MPATKSSSASSRLRHRFLVIALRSLRWPASEPSSCGALRERASVPRGRGQGAGARALEQAEREEGERQRGGGHHAADAGDEREV